MKGYNNEELTFRKLSKETLGDFLGLHENCDFSHTPGWHGCFCQFYYLTDDECDWMNMTFREKKALPIERVNTGRMNGYLAYKGGKAVGGPVLMTGNASGGLIRSWTLRMSGLQL